MFVKISKVFFILVLSILLVSVFVQWSNFSVGNTTNTTSKYARQSDGVFIEYYQNGKISSEEFYKDGLRYGNWRFYYEDGALKKELSYEKGLLNGEQRYFSTKGKLIYTEFFKKGEFEKQMIKNDSLYDYEVNLMVHGEEVFEQACKKCHLTKKNKIIHPYYLEKLSGDSLAIDTLFVDYFSETHREIIQNSEIDSLNIYDVHAVIHYIDKQYQTAKRRPNHAVRLSKLRRSKRIPKS